MIGLSLDIRSCYQMIVKNRKIKAIVLGFLNSRIEILMLCDMVNGVCYRRENKYKLRL